MPTTVTISEFQPGPGECNFTGTTAKLRRYYDSDWTDVDGVFHAEGVVGSSTGFFDEIACTLAANTITVPSFSATPTDNALIGAPRETWQLWDQAGTARNVIFEGFIPSSPSPTTFGTLLVVNQGQTLTNPPITYLNSAGVQALIDIALGIARFATSVIAGWVRLSVAAADVSDPIAVGPNDYAAVGHNGVTALDVAPAVAIAPTAIGANNKRQPPLTSPVYWASQYASFNAAVTAIGSAQATLIVSELMTGVTSATVPSTLTVQFQGAGGLSLTTGQTLTIAGPIVASPVKIFYNALSGQGTISFSGNKSIREYQVAWWGVKGDDSNHDEVPFQAAIDATPDNSILRFVGGKDWVMRWYGTVTVHNRLGLKIITASGGGSTANDGKNTIAWYGAAGGKVWDIDGCQNLLIDGFNVDARGVADFGLHIDQAPGSQTMTDSDFNNMRIYANGSRATFVGVSIAETSSNNCEDLRFENVLVIASDADATYATGTASISAGNSNFNSSSISLTGKEGWIITNFRAGPFTALYGLNDLWSSTISVVGSASAATLADNATNTVSAIAFNIMRPPTGWGFRIGGGGGGNNAFGILLKKTTVTFAAVGYEGAYIVDGGFSSRNLITFKGASRIFNKFRDEACRQFLVMPAGNAGPVEISAQFGGAGTTPLGVALIDAANAKLTVYGSTSEAQPHITIFTAGGIGSNSTLTAWDNTFNVVDSSYLNLTAFNLIERWDGSNGAYSGLPLSRSLLGRSLAVAGLYFDGTTKHLISLTTVVPSDPTRTDYGESGSNGRVYIDQDAVGTQFGGVIIYKVYTVSTLPTPVTGMMAYVTDGDGGLAWGATVVNSGAGATKYLVWWNGSVWAVVGK